MVLLAEVHQPLGGLALQVEDVQGGGGVPRCVEGGAEVGVLEHLTGGLQLVGALHAVVDGPGAGGKRPVLARSWALLPAS